jgi:hypothetical protein
LKITLHPVSGEDTCQKGQKDIEHKYRVPASGRSAGAMMSYDTGSSFSDAQDGDDIEQETGHS